MVILWIYVLQWQLVGKLEGFVMYQEDVSDPHQFESLETSKKICCQNFQKLILRMAASAPPPFCANCQVFDWPQPKDPASLLRCSRCKVLQYCGKLCQGEHWEKVHKHHCR